MSLSPQFMVFLLAFIVARCDLICWKKEFEIFVFLLQGMDGETSKVAEAEEDTNGTVTVYVFFEHAVRESICGWLLWGPNSYSLFGIDITMPTSHGQEEQGWDVKQPKLHAHIPAIDDNRKDGMVCAQLGSKFYFLGGFI